VFEVDSSPELGSALFKLERRDSAGAVKDLEAIAAKVEPARGGSELLLLAGRLRSGLGQSAEAERVFRAVMSGPTPASAAAAAFALAELQLRDGKRPEAIATLEQMLLAHPTSAVIPQARRLLDVARGAVPPV
jgi:tetratricopeptide (TPR) repeat protein